MSKEKPPLVVDVGEDNFEKEIVERSRSVPVVVDFWAEWCGPCQALGPVLEKLAIERNGEFVLAKVNVDLAPSVAQQFGVASIPDVRAFRDGKIFDGFVGVLPEPAIREFLDGLAPSETDKAVSRARALEEIDPDEAVAIYTAVLESEPDHDGARVGLTRVRIAQTRFGEAKELLSAVTPGGEFEAEIESLEACLDLHEIAAEAPDEETARGRLSEAPEDAEALYGLGLALARAQDYPEALRHLLLAAESLPKSERGRVRDVMVKIFHVVGNRSELADSYRERLTRLLY